MFGQGKLILSEDPVAQNWVLAFGPQDLSGDIIWGANGVFVAKNLVFSVVCLAYRAGLSRR